LILSRSKHSEDPARSEAVKRGNREQGTRKVEGHVKRQNDFINADIDFAKAVVVCADKLVRSY